MLSDGVHTLSTESSIAVNDKVGFADIGLDCDECKNNSDSADLSEPRAISESQQFGEISLHDMIVIEIVDRGGKSSCKLQDDQLAESPATVKGSSCAKDTSTCVQESPPKEMELFKAEFSLERSTLLRSPYFAKLLCGSCKSARKLQLNLRDPHTNIEAMIAASFFLDSGTQARTSPQPLSVDGPTICLPLIEFSVFKALPRHMLLRENGIGRWGV